MRALNVEEIDNLVEALGALVGARLQEVEVSPRGVGIGFWMKGQAITWLWFENLTWSPLLLPLTNCPQKGMKPLRPLALFLRAHYEGKILKGVERDATLGRAVRLQFGNDAAILFRLWPRGGNVIASSGGSRVSLMPIIPVTAETPVESNAAPTRGLADIVNEWANSLQSTKESSQKAKGEKKPKGKPQSPVDRLERAIKKVQEEIASKEMQPFRAVGEWLVANQSVEVPDEHRAFVDARRSLAWNIENNFRRAKESDRKLIVTKARLKNLNQELEEAKRRPEGATEKQSVAAPKVKSKSGAARYRTVKLGANVAAMIGKSAQDNLSLLRQARSWDMWMHLRDHPGSHAIVSLERGQKIGDEALKQVGAALVEQTFGDKAKLRKGDIFDLIVAECRYVKPIRGDKAGRVTFTHDRSLRFRYA